MANVNALISERLKKSEPSQKMALMAEKSAAGNLTSFSGVFQVTELSEEEKNNLEAILKTYSKNNQANPSDLKALIALTSEVKAITHQAALLHGERIKKAHTILTRYQEGAFTAWLLTTYGNRQTPYNLMQYYAFYQTLPSQLKQKIEKMPRQAIYTLASREGEIKAKLDLIHRYNGETKNELLTQIRTQFPLQLNDKRKENIGDNAIKLLSKGVLLLSRKGARLSEKQKRSLQELLNTLSHLIK